MRNLQSKKVLVTGANGFIGAHLIAALLQAGADVTGLVRKTSDCWRFEALRIAPKILTCDLQDQVRLDALIRPLEVNVVFHLAAEREREKLEQADAEMRSTCAGDNVMRAVANGPHLSRFVSLGSSLEIPDPTTKQPIGPHGKSKYRELQALRALAKKLGVPFSPTRTHYVFGPLQTNTKLVPTAIKAVRTGDPMSLTGPGIRKRYVYVLDLVAALLHVLNQSPQNDDVQLITSQHQVSNIELVQTIANLAGAQMNVLSGDFAERDFDRSDWPLQQAGTPLAGWQESTSLVDGLRACLDWEAKTSV